MTSTDDRSTVHRWKGAIKKALGWATADRQVEAEGLAEERSAARPTDDAVREAERAVKGRYDESLDQDRPPPEHGGGPTPSAPGPG